MDPNHGETSNGSTGNGVHQPAANDALAELQRQLSDPHKVALLREIFSKLDLVAFSLDAVDGTLRRAEVLADNIGDGIGEARAAVDPSVIGSLGKLVELTPDLVEGLEKLAPALRSESLARLGDPALVDALAQLADRTELLLMAAEAAEGFLARADTITENVADSVRDALALAQGGSQDALRMLTQLARLLPGVQTLLAQIEPLVETGAIEHLAQSKILAPEMVDVVAKIGDALHATHAAQKANPDGIGLLGALKTLRDPDARRALAYLTTFAKEFGKRLD